jgi:hypothetical protein
MYLVEEVMGDNTMRISNTKVTVQGMGRATVRHGQITRRIYAISSTCLCAWALRRVLREHSSVRHQELFVLCFSVQVLKKLLALTLL